MIYFIRSHHLPAISCPPWTPLIYFEWTTFLTPILSHTVFLPQTKTTSPLKRKAPTELEMHAKPYGIKVRYPVSRSRERPAAMVGGWRITIFESRRSFGTPTDFRRAWGGPFNSNIGKSGPLREDKFYADPKTNINSGPTTQLFPPDVPRHAKFEGSKIFFSLHIAGQAIFPPLFSGMIVPSGSNFWRQNQMTAFECSLGPLSAFTDDLTDLSSLRFRSPFIAVRAPIC